MDVSKAWLKGWKKEHVPVFLVQGSNFTSTLSFTKEFWVGRICYDLDSVIFTVNKISHLQPDL